MLKDTDQLEIIARILEVLIFSLTLLLSALILVRLVRIGIGKKGLPKFDNPPPPPPRKENNDVPIFPLDRVIKSRFGHFCKNCGSTMSRDGIIGVYGNLLCHNIECPNSKVKKSNYESGYFVFTLLEEVDRLGNTEGKRFVYTMHLHSQVVYSSIEQAQKDIDSVFAVNAPSWQQFMILPATLKQL